MYKGPFGGIYKINVGGGGKEAKTPANSTPAVIEGKFDVGDYKLYMHGPPRV